MNRIKKYYIYVFFSNLFFERSIFLLYLLHKGLSVGEVATYQAVINLTMLVFEVLTGVVADRRGKKVSLMIGALLMIVYHITMLLASQYYVFLVSAVIFGVGYTFVSGTDQSYIYDLVEERNHDTLKYLGYFSAVVTIAIGIASYLGGFIQRIQWEYLFIAGIAAQLIGIILLISLPNIKVRISEKGSERTKGASEIRTFVVLVREHSFMRDLAIYLTLNMGIVSAVYIFAQELLSKYGLSVTEITSFYAIDRIVSALVFANVDRITKKCGVWVSLIGSLILLLLSFSGITAFMLLPLSILCMSNFNNFMGTILENTFNIYVSDHIRSTANSILNACSSLVMVMIFLSVNMWKEYYTVVLGGLGMISVLLLLYMIIKYASYFKGNKELQQIK